MAKGRAKRREARRQRASMDTQAPTNEAMQHGDFDRAGMAYRRRPVIDVLFERGVLNARQYAAMGRYRDLYDLLDQSEARDSCDKLTDPMRGGSGSAEARMDLMIDGGWGLQWLDRELGALVHIARAVIGRDVSLSQWAIEQGGAKERRVYVGGKLVATYLEAKTLALKNATVDIRFAGDRIASALKA